VKGTGDRQFDSPGSVTADIEDNIYVADTGNNRIQKFDSSGKFIAKFGIKGANIGEFISPSDMSSDYDGNLYVADTGNNRIQKFDSSVTFISKWGEF